MNYFYYPEKGGLETIEQSPTLSFEDYDGCLEYCEDINGGFAEWLKATLGMISCFIRISPRREGAYELFPPEGWELPTDEYDSFRDYLAYEGIDELIDNGWQAEPYHYGEELESRMLYYHLGEIFSLSRLCIN